MLLKRYLFFLMLITSCNTGYCQWDKNAGVVESYTHNSKITASSGTNIVAVIDSDFSSFWESSPPLPSNYISNPNQNIFFKKSFTSKVSKNATDGVLSSKTENIYKPIVITFDKPEKAILLSVKIDCSSTVIINILTNKNTITYNYNVSDKYQLKEIYLPQNTLIESINLKSNNKFSIFEIAGLYKLPTEEITFDLGKIVPIGQIGSKHYNGEGVKSITVFASKDNISWEKIEMLNPMATPYIKQLVEPAVIARYIKIIFQLQAKPYQKAKIYEFNAWDSYGPYGKPSVAIISKNTFAQSFGINAIWGWGYNVCSNKLDGNIGANRFNKIAKLARNYHSLDWDIKSPSENPDYDNMQQGNGTKATPWLNWDDEYEVWKKAGFTIDACLMFNNQYFNDTLWHNTTQEAMNYGMAFSLHFSKNKPLISIFEVGNEPWDYSKNKYRKILEGMSLGLKLVSDKITVLPCALQATNPAGSNDNYISDYLNSSNTQNIDGLVTHVYSYVVDGNGTMSSVNPENYLSEVWSISNLERYSRKNLNNLPIYVTEFGYDGAGGGDDCAHSVCVSELEQAIYGARMSLILFRLGVQQFYWYYYADGNYQSTMHSRSGLVSSSEKGMKEKLSFGTFELMQDLIGDFYFNSVIEESSNAYVYALSDKSGKIKRIIAWRPTSSNHNSTKLVSIPGNYDIKKVIPLIKDNKITTQQFNNHIDIELSGIPVIIILSD